MAFDQETRNRLSNFVGRTRDLLTKEFTKQCQNLYGLDPEKGTVADISALSQLNDVQLETAKILRSTLDHYLEAAPSSDQKTLKESLQRIVREQAFTVLNRLSALKMAEARGLLIEVLADGYQSKAFQLYKRLAGPALGETGDTYQHFLFSVFDELAVDLPMFDRFSPNGRLFPRESVLLNVLEEINHQDLKDLWSEDETIGWIYQYFNSQEERKAMRKASNAPRNSRELAVRNQFFTPRYVVEFLVDNSLGKFWLNQTGGQTILREKCNYLLVKSDKEKNQTNKIRDPRSIKLLDPACGSMHFGLYAFDLFLKIYKEAWEWEERFGKDSLIVDEEKEKHLEPLKKCYENKEEYLFDVPRLIIEHNIYGIEIDARAAQIARLALWLRAQREWHEMGIKPIDRPKVGKEQIVAAVAPPANEELRKKFSNHLDPKDAELFEKTLDLLQGAPELGGLLRVEKDIPRLVKEVFGEQGPIFADTDDKRWQEAEYRLRSALKEFVKSSDRYSSQLFANDAIQVLRFIDLLENKFDIVVMNPPFGKFPKGSKKYLKDQYPNSCRNILCAFISRMHELAPDGFVGSISDRTWLQKTTYESFREELLTGTNVVNIIADLGWDVLDGAQVATCLTITGNPNSSFVSSIDARNFTTKEKASFLKESINVNPPKISNTKRKAFSTFPDCALAHWCPDGLKSLFEDGVKIDPEIGDSKRGISSGDTTRAFRLIWEVPLDEIGLEKRWAPLQNGGSVSPFYRDTQLVSWYEGNFKALEPLKGSRLQNLEYIGKPGLSWSKRCDFIAPYLMSRGHTFTDEGQGLFLHGEKQSWYLLALLNSKAFQYSLNLFCGQHKSNGYVGKLKIPRNINGHSQKESLIKLAKEAYQIAKSVAIKSEPHSEFDFSFLYKMSENHESIINIVKKWLEKDIAASKKLQQLQNEIDEIVFEVLNLDENDIAIINKSLSERQNISSSLYNQLSEDDKVGIESRCLQILMFMVGIAFGHWTSNNLNINHSEPFEEPKIDNSNNSVEKKNTLVFTNDKDSEFSILKALEQAEEELWTNTKAKYLWEIFSTLEVSSWEVLFSSDGLFFDWHVDKYSFGRGLRRSGPIYWPIASKNGSLTIWLYYHQLSNQTLYHCINDIIEPRLKSISQEKENVRDSNTSKLESLTELEVEIKHFRDKLEKIAQKWRPNLNDGVQVNAAPFWDLFQHKKWRKQLKKVWNGLENGEYEWSHLAMTYWPERVVKSCLENKSIAIAHGLEQELWEEVEVEKEDRWGNVKKEKEWKPKELSKQELRKIADRFKK